MAHGLIETHSLYRLNFPCIRDLRTTKNKPRCHVLTKCSSGSAVSQEQDVLSLHSANPSLSSEMGLSFGGVIILTSEQRLLTGVKVALNSSSGLNSPLVSSISQIVTISLLKVSKGGATMTLQ